MPAKHSKDIASLRPAAKSQPKLREAIIDCAEKLFRTLGYQKVTVGDIAKELGMSSPNIYRFFASKAQLRESLAARFSAQIETACAAAIKGPGSARDRLSAMIREHHRMTVDRFLTEANVHEMLSVAIRENWSVVETHRERMHILIEEVIREGIVSGAFSVSDAVLAARLVYYAIVVFTDPSKVALLSLEEPAEELDAMCRLILGGLASGEL